MMHRPKLCIAQLTALRGDGADMALGVALVLQYLYLNVFCIVSYNLYDMAVGGWWVGGVADSKQPGDKQTPNLAPSKDSYPTNLGRIWTYNKGKYLCRGVTKNLTLCRIHEIFLSKTP